MRNKLRRAEAKRSPAKTMLIVTEGSVTEPSYFKSLKTSVRLTSVDIEISKADGTDPRSVLNTAIRLRDDQQKRAKSNDTIAPYDEVWIVFDTEGAQHPRHQQIPSVLAEASQKNIYVAWSNPCFEFWLLLHVSDRLRPGEDCKAVSEELKSVESIPNYSKSMDMAPFMEHVQIACKRAVKCNDQRYQDEAYTNNPSTVVHRLVEILLGNSRHKP